MGAGSTIILDGGMGRELQRAGAPFRQPEWSALALSEAPQAVEAVHAAYIASGANVITSNSYAVVPFHIGEERFAAEGQALAALAGELARRAVEASGKAVQVAGSLPPLFGSYRPDLFEAGRVTELLTPLVNGLAPTLIYGWRKPRARSSRRARSMQGCQRTASRSGCRLP